MYLQLMRVQTQLPHLNLDARSITDACLRLMLPLAGQIKELDMCGACTCAIRSGPTHLTANELAATNFYALT
jgi:hypothetical protein